MDLIPFEPGRAQHLNAIVSVWNSACGDDLAISPRTAAYNTRPAANWVQEGRFVVEDGALLGFVLASVVQQEPLVSEAGEGWIDALAVLPAAQRRGAGAALLDWAERWLAQQGSDLIRLGGSLRPFAPGVPEETGSSPFFARRGYAAAYATVDMAADLAGYATPPAMREVDAVAQPAQPGHVEHLFAFLRREFPGRWRYEAEMFLADGGRLADYMLLWTARGVDGCCLMTFPDSVRPVERHFPYRLPKPWGQVGSIGISADCRGRGYGACLLDAALRRLHNSGINGCVIDWTNLVDFYGKFGFTPYRSYLCLARPISHNHL